MATVYKVDRCPHCMKSIRQRSSEQNDALHALLQDIADQKEWAGQRLDVEDWKRLMTAAWLRATGQGVRVFPSIDGQGIDMLYQRTSRLSKQDMTELIEYCMAWAIDQGVNLRERTTSESASAITDSRVWGITES